MTASPDLCIPHLLMNLSVLIFLFVFYIVHYMLPSWSCFKFAFCLLVSCCLFLTCYGVQTRIELLCLMTKFQNNKILWAHQVKPPRSARWAAEERVKAALCSSCSTGCLHPHVKNEIDATRHFEYPTVMMLSSYHWLLHASNIVSKSKWWWWGFY